ncbi:MAG: hypothetical protein WC454_01740 [Phycisphaerae bacterium]
MKVSASKKLSDSSIGKESVPEASTERQLHSHTCHGEIFMDSDCIYACPQCLRTCVLTQGHYSQHRCSEGHTWL